MSDERPVLLCDIGNVLLRVEREHTWGSLGERLDMPGDRIRELLADHAIHRQLELGLITPEEFLREMLDLLDHSDALAMDELVDSMGKSFYLNDKLMEVIAQNRTRLRVILLSNTNAIDMQTIEAQFGLLKWADDAVLSHEIHMRKPDQMIYLYTIDQFGLEPGRTLFIDDLPENVKTANLVGLEAAVYQSPGQVAQLLSAVLNRQSEG